MSKEPTIEHWISSNRGNRAWGRNISLFLLACFMHINSIVISNFPSGLFRISTFYDAGLTKGQNTKNMIFHHCNMGCPTASSLYLNYFGCLSTEHDSPVNYIACIENTTPPPTIWNNYVELHNNEYYEDDMGDFCEYDAISNEEPPTLVPHSKDSSDYARSSSNDDEINYVEPNFSNPSLTTHYDYSSNNNNESMHENQSM